MLDLVSITFDIKHEPFGSIRTKENESGEVKANRFSKTIYINKAPVFVTSLDDGSRINIRCCPLKVRQGHNVFGTNSLKKIWHRLIVEVLRELDIRPSVRQFRKLLRGEFYVDEIHITHRYRVENYPMVGKVIGHVKRYASESLFSASLTRGIGVRLTSPSRRATWLIYDKHREFCDKRTKEHKYLEATAEKLSGKASKLLEALSEKSIRVELRLDKEYLRRHQLDRGKNWTSKKAIEVYQAEFAALRLAEMPAMPELTKLYAEIEDLRLRAVIILWAHGEDLTAHYSPTTVRKYRKAAKGCLGIDLLKDQPVLEESSIKMTTVFDKPNLLIGFPRWVSKYPTLAFR